MLNCRDFSVLEDGDITLSNGDIGVESISGSSIMNIIANRLVGRYGDIVSLSPVTAGLERYLYQRATKFTLWDAQDKIEKALLVDNLLSTTDYKITLHTDQDSLAGTIAVKLTPYSSPSYIKLYINNENQRILKETIL